jgi:fibronectin-binding autotransporter adhesin
MEKLSSQISALRATPLGRQCARSLRALNRRTVACVRVALTLFMVGYLANPAGLRADSLTWNGTTDALWATLSNWSAGSAVPGSALGETATFDNAGNANVVIDLGGGVTILNINFATAAVVSYTLGTGGPGAQTLTLENGGSINLASDVTANQTIDANLVLGQDDTASTYTLDNDASGISLIINGAISGSTVLNSAGAKTLAVTGTDGSVDLNGVIANGGATSLAITKSGSGSLTLAGANTFTGGVTLDAGLLTIGNATALGTGTFTINGGTVAASSPLVMTAANPISWNGDFTFGGANNLNLGAGAVTIGGNRTVTVTSSGTTLTMTNIIGTGNLTKSGAGNLTFSGTNTFTGNITVNGGFIEGTGNQSSNGFGSRDITVDGGGYRLVAGGQANFNPNANTTEFIIGASGGTIDVASGTVTLDDLPLFNVTQDPAGSSFVAGTGQLSGSGTLTKEGTGTLSVRGQRFFTGAVNVNNGGLTAQDATAVGSALSLAGGTTLTPNTFSTPVTLTLSGDATIAAGVNSPAFTGNVDLGAATPRQLNVTGTAQQGVGFGTLVNGSEFNKAGAGYLSLTADNSASGLTSIRVLGGMLGLNNANALPATANLELQSSTTNPVVGLSASVPAFNLTLGVNPGEVQFTAGTGGGAGFAAIDGTRTVNLNGGGTVTWDTGGFVPNARSLILGNTLAAGTVDFQNQIDLNGANRTLQVENGTARVDAILSGGMTAGAAFTLTKTGQGALSLPNAMATGSGSFNLNGGTVLIGNAAAFGANTLTNISGNISSFDATAYTIANPFTLAGNVSYGQLSGGTGALTFSGNFDGGVGVNVVRTITNFVGVTFSGNSGNGPATSFGISKTGPGTLTLSGANLATGANTVSQGVLNLDYSVNDNSKLVGALNLGGGTLQLTGGTHVENVTSTILQIGASTVTRSGGTAVLNMNALTNARVTGGALNISGLGVAQTDTLNSSNILGGYITLGLTNWAVNSTGAGDAPITGLTSIHTNFVTTGLGTNLVVGATHTLAAAAISANSLRFTNTGAVNLTLGSGGLTLTSGGILDSANTGGIVTITGGTLTAAAGTPDLVIHQNSASEMRINSRITGTNGVTKTGSGTLALTNLAGAFNDYTGPTYINGGTIRITNDSNLGTAPAAGPAAQPGRLVFNGGALQVTADTTTFTNRGMTLLAGGGTFNVTGTGTVYSNQAAITGPGNLTKIGNGTLSLNAVPVASSYTGRTIILDGNLVIAGGSDNRLGTAPGTYTPDHLTIDGAGAYLGIPANTTLSANRGITLGSAGGGFNVTAGTLTVPGVITGPGALRVNGGSAVTLQGVNTYAGGTTVSNTALRVNNDLALGSGALTVRFGGTIASSDYNARTIANQLIINTNAVLSDTTGHGALTFTGGVNLPSVNASIITVNGFGGVTFDSDLSGGAVGHQVSKTGVGTLNLVANNTLTGTALISVGRLAVSGAAGSIQGITAIAVSGTNALLQIGATTDTTLGVDRILNTAGINLTNYGGIVMNGSTAAGVTAETVGGLNIGGLGGGTILSVTLNPSSGQEAALTSANLSRSAGSTVLFRGTGLGSTGADSSRMLFTTTPGLTGGGGVGSQISILPYAMADTTTTGLGGSSFVTYDPTVGVRLLTGSEYDTVFTGGTVDRNVSLDSGTTTLTANQGINAIRLNGGNLTIDPGVTLTNSSGAILFSSTGTIGGGNLSLASAEGIIHIGGASSVAGTINSAISGAYGLTISGNDSGDVLTLGGNNTFTGPITINRGQVILGSPTALGGTDAGQFNAVRMNNFASSLDLNGQSAMIGTLDGGAGMLIDNSSATPLTLALDTLAGSSRFDSPITQTGGGAVSLVKNSVNTLDLRGANTASGSIAVNGGQLTLSGNVNNFANASSLTLGRGTTLLLDYGNGNNPANRINNAAAIDLNGATLTYQVATGARNYAETLGALTLNSGGSTITTGQADSGQTANLIIASLTRNSGATVNFTGAGQGATTRNELTLTTPPTLDDGIVGGWATVAGTNFAKYTNGTVQSIVALAGADYTVGIDQGSWLASSNVRLTASTNLTANRNINSLNIFQAGATTVDLGANTLNVESGGIAVGRDFNSIIQNGTLTAGGTPDTATDELFLHTYSSTNNPLEVSAVIANNGTDTLNVVKAGTGTLLLSGANTFTGSLTHNGGVLRVDPTALTALNANANAIVLNSGILASSDSTARQFTSPVTLQGSVILGDGNVGTGPIDLNGAMSVSSGRRTITVDVNPTSGEHVLSGAITGAGQIFKAGVGSLTLTGTYGAAGPLMVGAGTVIVNGASGAISTGVIVRPGATLTLDNTLNNVNRLTGGTLVLGTSTGNTTTFNYLIDPAAAGTTWSQSVGDLVINGTSGTVRINTIAANVDPGLSTSTLTFASLTKDPGSILDFFGDNIGTTDNGGLYTNRIMITGQADGPIAGATVSSTAEGTDDAAYDSVIGVYRLINFDFSYTPGSHPSGGDLVGTPASWLIPTTKASPAGGVRLDPNQSIVLNQLRLNTNAVLTTPGYNGIDLNNGLLRLSSGTLRAAGSSNQWVYGGALTAGATPGAAGTLLVDVSSGITLKVDAVVTNNTGGTVSLTKQGTGTLELNAVNFFTGKSAVNGGTLAILADSGLGAVPGVPTADAVTLNGGTLRLGNGASIAANRGITLGVNHGTVEVETGNAATIGSVIAGVNRNLTKIGDGSLTLNRANTFSGIMTLNGGTLVATANAGALGAGTLTMSGGTTLVLQNDTGLNFARNTTVNGNSTITSDRLTGGAGVKHLLGTLTIGAQTLTVDSGLANPTGTQELQFTNVTMTGASTFVVNDGSAATLLTLGVVNNGGNLLTIDGTGDTRFAGAVTNTGGLRKIGTGSITAAAASTYGGATAIENGSIIIASGNNRLPVGTTVTLGSGTDSGRLILGDTAARTQELADLEISGTGTDNRVVGGFTAPSTLTLRLAAGSHTYDGFFGGPGLNENQFALTKTGLGDLTLNQANTYVGNTVIDSGTLFLGVAGAYPANSPLFVRLATNITYTSGVLDLNGQNATPGTITLGHTATDVHSVGQTPSIINSGGAATLTLGSNVVYNAGSAGFENGTATIAATVDVDLGGAIRTFTVNNSTVAVDLDVPADISGTGAGISKAGAGALRLAGNNTFDNGFTLTAGDVLIASATAFGTGTFTNAGGRIDANGGPITMSANNPIALNGTLTFIGSDSLDMGTGAITINGAAGNRTIAVDANTLTLGGVISDGTANGIIKAGAGTLVLGGASVYTGPTLVSNGTVQITVNDALPTTTGLTIGTNATVGTLDLNGFNQTIGSLAVRGNNSGLDNTIDINTGNTLTITGNVAIGATNSGATTRLVGIGGGSMLVGTGAAGTFQVGGVAGNGTGGTTTVDLSGLASLTVNYDATGTFRLGDSGSGSATPAASDLRLPVANTITVGNFRIGDGTGTGMTNTVILGSGANVINADTINIGSAASGIRSSGAMRFDDADTTGTLQIRALDGTSRATINMLNSSGSTAVNMSSSNNFAGHTADILASTLTMASRSANTGGATAILSFDQGTLDVTSLVMGRRTGASTGNMQATLNLGDSVAVGTPTTTIGDITMAQSTGTGVGGGVTANLNITGGSVNVGVGGINMANAAAGQTATSTIDITGGTVTVSGDIVRTGGAGTETATLNLNGASAVLDMTGNDVSGPTAFNFTDGTLKDIGNVSSPISLLGTGERVIQHTLGTPGGITTAISGAAGVGIQKTGSGILGLTAVNTYDGTTRVSDGTLALNGAGSIASSAVNVDNAAGTFDISTITAAGTSIASLVGVAGSTVNLGGKELTAGGNNTSTLMAGSINGTGGSLTKVGTGALELSGNNGFTGAATVSAGTLDLTADGALGAATTVNVNGGTLRLTGSGSVNRVNDAGAVNFGGGTVAINDTGASGVSETLGVLTLTVTSVIDFGTLNNASSVLTFADSSTSSWTAGQTVDVHNWSGTFTPGIGGTAGGVDQLHFLSSGLTAGQLAQIRFYNDAGTTFLGLGMFSGTEVVPTPEPATWASLGALGLLLGWRERRRLTQLVKRNRR